jgi:hypothetical protein
MLTYKDSNHNNKKPLNAGDKQILKMFVIYTHRLSKDNVLLEDLNSTALSPSGLLPTVLDVTRTTHSYQSCLYQH